MPDPAGRSVLAAVDAGAAGVVDSVLAAGASVVGVSVGGG